MPTHRKKKLPVKIAISHIFHLFSITMSQKLGTDSQSCHRNEHSVDDAVRILYIGYRTTVDTKQHTIM